MRKQVDLRFRDSLLYQQWVEANVGHLHIRGWLVTESLGGYVPDKHSVVGIGRVLLEIAPRLDRVARQFPPHEGTLEELDLSLSQMTVISSQDSAHQRCPFVREARYGQTKRILCIAPALAIPIVSIVSN